MRTLYFKQLLLISVIALVMVLQGCATGGSSGVAYEHGIGYCNIGAKTLVYRHLEYGNVVWLKEDTNRHKGGDTSCLGGSVYVAQMPIPETMKIEWQTEGGVRHKVDVPLRSLISSKHPTTQIKVRFNDEHLQIMQINLDGLQPFKNVKTIIFEQ
jgi:hypothetical protein